MEFRDLKKQYQVLKSEIDNQIKDVISGAHFISGAHVTELEGKLAEYVGVKHCITCGNGTDAITLAMMVWNIGPGDAVFVPDFTFFSSGECPASVGATPIFVDVDNRTFNLDPKKLEESIKKIIQDGQYKPKAVVAVDLFGLPADYTEIRKICDKYKLLLMEDGAQGFGGSINGRKACSFGDISTTSFFPAKPLGCYGDGGAVFTDNDEWAELIRSLAVHGKSKTNKYDNLRLGMNSRLDTIQAAVLLPKLKAFIDYELDDVNNVAKKYTELLNESELQLPLIPKDYKSSWAQYTIQLPDSADRAAVQTELKAQGIPSMIYYLKPMHQQKAFKGTDSAKSKCPVTEELCKKVLSIPMGPYVCESDINMVSNALLNALN